MQAYTDIRRYRDSCAAPALQTDIYNDVQTYIQTFIHRQKDVHTYKLRCAYSVAPEETKTGGATGRSQGRQFASRYSPVFQKCVVDVEAKLKADGATALKSLEGAFRICNKSIGDRCVCAIIRLECLLYHA